MAIYRVVGDEENRRWLTRARLQDGHAVATADSAWVDRAVCSAKTHGRDQVLSHAGLLPRGAVDASETVGEVELF